MENDYLRGLRAALTIMDERPTAYCFSAAGKVRELVAAEESRLAPIKRRNERTARALAPRGPL